MLHSICRVVIDEKDKKIFFTFADGTHRTIPIGHIHTTHRDLCVCRRYILQAYNTGNILFIPATHIFAVEGYDASKEQYTIMDMEHFEEDNITCLTVATTTP